MKFERYNYIKEYRNEIKDFLGKNEVINNLPLGIINSRCENEEYYKDEEKPFMGLVRDENGNIVLTTLMTPPFNMVISGDDENIENAIEKAITYLLENEINVPGVIGAIDIAKRFAEMWESKTNCKLNIEMNQRIYRLDRVNDVPLSKGKMRLASLEDIDLVSEWFYNFINEIGEKADKKRAIKSAEYFVGNSKIYLWEIDGNPVSMVGSSRKTENGIVISHVYTPTEYRGKGYATSCVAAKSQLLLDKGYKFCSLYTDLSNPTSNSIYMQIGYKPIKDSIMYSFK